MAHDDVAVQADGATLDPAQTTEDGEQMDHGDSEASISPEVQALIDREVAGLKATNAKLKAEKRALATRLRALEGLELDQVEAALAQLERDAEAELLAEGRFEEVLARRSEKAAREHVAALEERDQKIADLETQLAARDEQLAARAIDDQVRQAAAEVGLLPMAVEDALNRARRTFSLDASGNAAALDGEGKPIQIGDGEGPLTPASWLQSLRGGAPHWWPASSGAAAPGAGANGSEGLLSYEQAGQLDPERYARLRREGRIA